MDQLIIYLAGPMAGIKEFNRPAFDSFAKKLREQGAIVINPAETPNGLSYGSYMDISFAQIRAADELYFLPKWEGSKGANAEMLYAVALGKPVTVFTEKIETIKVH